MNIGFLQKSGFLNSFFSFTLLLRALASWGLEENDYVTWLLCTSLSHAGDQQINLEPRGTLLRTVTLGFILEAGDYSQLSHRDVRLT